MRCWAKWIMRSSQRSSDFGGEMFCLYQKAWRASGLKASFLGMKLISTTGRTPLARRPS